MVDFSVDLIFSNFDKLMKVQTSLENQIKLTEKNTDQFNQLNKSLDVTSDKIKEIEKRRGAFSTIISGTVLDKFARLHDRFTRFNQAFETIGKKKGFDVGLGDFFKNFGKQSVNFSKNLGDIFGKGLGGVMKTFSLSLKGLMVGFKGIAAAAGAVLGPILLIGAAVLILWRVWKQNIGGMQTYFFKFVGALKDAWAKVALAFDKSLRKLAPVFKAVFALIYSALLPPIKIIEGLFLGILEVINPIFDALSEIFEPFAELFGFTADGKEFINILNGVSKALVFIGKVVGTIISVALKPLVAIIKFLLTPLKWVIDAIKYIVESIGKVSSIFDIFNKKSESSDTGTKQIVERQKTVQTLSNLTQPQNNSIVDNRNFTVHSAGAINEQNAIGIVNILKKDFKLGRKA